MAIRFDVRPLSINHVFRFGDWKKIMNTNQSVGRFSRARRNQRNHVTSIDCRIRDRGACRVVVWRENALLEHPRPVLSSSSFFLSYMRIKRETGSTESNQPYSQQRNILLLVHARYTLCLHIDINACAIAYRKFMGTEYASIISYVQFFVPVSVITITGTYPTLSYLTRKLSIIARARGLSLPLSWGNFCMGVHAPISNCTPSERWDCIFAGRFRSAQFFAANFFPFQLSFLITD